MNGIQAILSARYRAHLQRCFPAIRDPADPLRIRRPEYARSKPLDSFTKYWNGNFATRREMWRIFGRANLCRAGWRSLVGRSLCRDPAAAYGLFRLGNMAPFRIGIRLMRSDIILRPTS